MKKYMLIIGLLAVAGAGIGFFIYNKPHQNIGAAKPDFKMTATELFAAFEADEQAANQKYLDKIIEVTGTVQEVKKDEEDKPGVTLEGGGMMFGVICKMDDLTKHKRTDFQVGEEITMKGICTGVLMDVVLVRCVEL